MNTSQHPDHPTADNDRSTEPGETAAAWWTSSARLRLLLAALGLLVLMMVFFWPVVLEGKSLLPTDAIFFYDPVWHAYAAGREGPSNDLLLDIVAQFYPYAAFNHGTARQGVFPLWNPYYLTGHPYFAGYQPAMLFPLNWFFLWDPKLAWGAIAILKLWLAALFTYIYLREVKVGTWGSLAGAITFALSGYFIVRLNYPMVHVQMWLPLLLWLTEKIVKRPRAVWVAAAAAVFGIQFFAGHAETSFALGLVWGLYVLYRLVNKARDAGNLRPALKPGGLLALAAGIGLLLAAVQVVPFVALLEGSSTLYNRVGEVSSEGSAARTPGDLWRNLLVGINILLPNFFGTPLDDNFWSPLRQATYLFKINYIGLTRYLGLVPLWLAGVGLLSRWRDRPIPFFGAMALVSLAADLRVPVFSLIYEIPPFSLAGGSLMPGIYMIGPAFLAGFGLDTLARGPTPRLLKRAWLSLLGLCLVVLLAALFMYYAVDLLNADQSLQGRLDHGVMLALFRPFNWRLHFPLAFGLVGVVLVFAYSRRWLATAPTMVLFLLLMAGELYAFGWDFNPTLPPEEVFPETAAVGFLRQNSGLQRVTGLTAALKPNSSLVFALYGLGGYEDLSRSRYRRFTWRQLRSWRRQEGELFLEPDAERLLDLASVRYVIVPYAKLSGASGEDYPLVYSDDDVAIFENANGLPRAYVVHGSEVVPDESASLDRVYSPDFALRQVVILESAVGLAPPVEIEATPEGSEVTGSESVQIANYGFHEVEVRAQLTEDGYLVLTDAFDPDWDAWVDGQPAPVYQANDVFRAVRLDAGQHTVTFRYSPRAVQIGLYLSLLGLGLVGGLLILTLFLRFGRRSVRQA